MWVFRDFRSTCYLNTYWVEFSCHLIYSPLQVSLLLSFFPLIVFTSLCFPPPCRPVLMCRLVCVCVWTAGSHSIKPHCLEMESLLFFKEQLQACPLATAALCWDLRTSDIGIHLRNKQRTILFCIALTPEKVQTARLTSFLLQQLDKMVLRCHM